MVNVLFCHYSCLDQIYTLINCGYVKKYSVVKLICIPFQRFSLGKQLDEHVCLTACTEQGNVGFTLDKVMMMMMMMMMMMLPSHLFL